MRPTNPARKGAITLLLCILLLGLAGPAQAKPVPASIQHSTSPHRVQGVLISLHGGGWVGDRNLAGIHRKMGPFVQPALEAHWDVVHVAYSSGAARALAEIRQVYLRIRRNYRSLPVCLIGNSAGGHLALTFAGISAKLRGVPAVDCVIASAPPTDLIAYRRQVALKSPERRRKLTRFLEVGFRSVRQMIELSPVRFIPSYRSDALLFTVPGDPVVNPMQVMAFTAKLKRHRRPLFSKGVVLPAGNHPFVHRGVSPVGWAIYREQLRAFLRRA